MIEVIKAIAMLCFVSAGDQPRKTLASAGLERGEGDTHE